MTIVCDEPGYGAEHHGDVELETLRRWIAYGGDYPLLPSPPPGWTSRGSRGCVCPAHLALPSGEP